MNLRLFTDIFGCDFQSTLYYNVICIMEYWISENDEFEYHVRTCIYE